MNGGGSGEGSARQFVYQAARVLALTSDAVRVHDGSGTIRGVRVKRPFRDTEVTQIDAATNPIQGMIMARELFR